MLKTAIKNTLRCGLVSALLAANALASDVSFLVFGDMPYNKEQLEQMKALSSELKARDAAHKLPFGIFYGDTKAGGERCTKERLKANRDLILGMIDAPVFFTPGDNDWTDCDRGGDDELHILDNVLRPMYFSADMLPENRFDQTATWQVARQPRFPENARWRYGDLQFGALHILATGNGREEITVGDIAEKLDRVDARDAANLEWLADIFIAGGDAKALVLAIHTDPTKADDSLPSCSADIRQNCHPYRGFLAALKGHALNYGKPVLLVHGDTNPYCLNEGYLGVQNLLRFNASGDYHPGMTEVRFADQIGAFRFHHLGEGDSFKKTCPLKGE